MSTLYQRINDLVRRVPQGKVMTYGQIGQLASCSGRVVGFAMAALKPGSDVPWQRVINAKGEVSRRRDAERDLFQRDLLEAEGLRFDCDGRVDLSLYNYEIEAPEA